MTCNTKIGFSSLTFRNGVLLKIRTYNILILKLQDFKGLPILCWQQYEVHGVMCWFFFIKLYDIKHVNAIDRFMNEKK